MTIKRVDRGRNHWYTIDGQKAYGVTTAIGDGLPKPALVRWASKSVAEYVADNVDHLRECFDFMDREQLVAMLKQVPWSQRDQAAVRGTDVHDLAEKIAHGQEVEVPEHLEGYVHGAVKFLDDWQAEPIITEAVVASRTYLYAGTLDGIYRLPDGRVILTDWKTTASGIYPETALQLAAYANAEVYLDGEDEKSMADLGITEGYGVWLKPDGYQVHPLDIGPRTFKSFLYVLSVARWSKTARECVGDPCDPPNSESAA